MRVGKARPRLDGADPINRGLVGFWQLSETGGNVALDISSNRFNGTLQNTVTRPASVFGKVTSYTGGGTLSTNVNLGSLDSFDTVQTPLSISAWIFPTNITGNKTIFSQYLNYTGGGQLGKLLVLAGGAVTWGCTTAAGGYQLATGPSVTANVWSHVGVTVSGPTSGPTVTVWAGNTRTTTVFTATGTPASSMNHRIGSSDFALTGQPEGFVGQIGSVRAWNRGIRLGEVSRILANPYAGISQFSMTNLLAGPVIPTPPIGASGGGSSTIWIM